MPDTIIGCRALRVAAPFLIHTQGVLTGLSEDNRKRRESTAEIFSHYHLR